jgi:dephospho-CoA kinase
MLKIGLTGGIASGKSVVGEMFVDLGAHLIQADRISHDLMRPGQPVYDEVVRHFGKAILNGDGTVSRPKLAEVAFATTPGEKSRVDELNRIVHPAVIRRQQDWMEEIGRRHPAAVGIVEAALILEAHSASLFDRLIVVTCREEQRVQRFAERQKSTLDAARGEVARRMAAQLPDEEKIKAADFVIDNSGSLDETRKQVAKIWQNLKV